VRVALYENKVGVAHPSSPQQMFWQSSYVTKDGTLIEWGTGDHGLLSDNGVREFDPATGTQSYVYPNNNGTRDVQQYDNLFYVYVPRIDSLVISGRHQYHRASGTWLSGSLLNNGRNVIGTGTNDLMYPLTSFWVEGFQSSFNAHQAWSAQHDCGVCISGGLGGDLLARSKIWIMAPSRGFGSYAQPYVIFERTLPPSAGGAAPNKIGGRDGCCFAGDYVYWVGGSESGYRSMETSHFFRMRITPHLTSTTQTLAIERLPDAPKAFQFALLRYDPHANSLLCITNVGIFAFDITNWSWIDVTPQGYRDDYAAPPTKGLLPYGCMGDFVESRNGRTLRKFIWRPGMNHGWDYDYGGSNQERMYNRFRAISLTRSTA
jgi:hypothetical protein